MKTLEDFKDYRDNDGNIIMDNLSPEQKIALDFCRNKLREFCSDSDSNKYERYIHVRDHDVHVFGFAWIIILMKKDFHFPRVTNHKTLIKKIKEKLEDRYFIPYTEISGHNDLVNKIINTDETQYLCYWGNRQLFSEARMESENTIYL